MITIIDDNEIIATAMHAGKTQAVFRRFDSHRALCNAIIRQAVHSWPVFDGQAVTLHALSPVTKVKSQRVNAAIDRDPGPRPISCSE
jgi:hypothetical protein